MKTTIKQLLTAATLSGLSASASAQGLLSTLGSTHGNYWNVGGGYFTIAQQFTTGNNSDGVGSVQFYTGNLYGSGDPLSVCFYTDASGSPGSLVSNGSLTGPGSLSSDAATTFNASGLTLAANTTYWLVFTNNSTDVQVANMQGHSLVTTSSDGWTLGDFAYENQGSSGAYSLTYNGIANPVFSINLAPVPEPSTIMLTGLGMSVLFFFRKK